MKKRDFRRAFGDPDAAFAFTVKNTLRRLDEEEKKPVKRKMRVSAAIAVAACLIISTAAFAAANHWGLFDFLNQGQSDSAPLPEAIEILATEPPQEGGTGELAGFQLREAVYDGEYAYLVVDVTPRQELLLIGPSYGLEDPMRLMTGDSANSLTIGEYAEQNDLQMAYVTISSALDALGEEFIRSIDCHWEEDGTLVLMLTCTVSEQEGSAFASTLQCSVTPLIPAASKEDAILYGYYEENADEPTYASTGYVTDEENQQETELAFTLDDANRHNTLASSQSAEYPSCGVRVDSVRLTASPMALYYEIHFTVTDEAAYAATEDGVWFEFLDANGNALPDGATRGAEVQPQADGSLVQSGSLAAREELPETVTLRAYNCWTQERYENHELTLEP